MRRPRLWGLLVPVLLTPVAVAPASLTHAQSKPPANPTPAIPPPWRASESARNTGAPKITTPHRPSAAPKPVTCTHSVRRGESISRIAARYRVTRQSLVDANRLVDPAALHTGQRLVVPGCRATPPAVPSEVRVTEPVPEGTILKRVGPRRILTALVLSEPDFQGERIPLVWPVEGPVISTFGQRSRGWHAGVDIMADIGSDVFAAAPGTVIYSGWIRAYGQVVKIQHMNGFITLYAHNLKNLVEIGDEVEAGQVIANVGRSGHATGPHVHFEVRRDGKAYNPLHLLEPSDRSPVFEDDVATSSSDLDEHE
ncbi:MAG TPA: peptidoglycan DD-metalloendopeptidase family protein [Candidatus Nitrosotalea sp.]|nr:peptidoglycan DD-metalloendopeptidase family protein [Candidatus Nitrosotalea sp.]